ncbi:MAG: bifunctional metallophosphatase/5'-nucleotidase [Novosphingobium sp.]
MTVTEQARPRFVRFLPFLALPMLAACAQGGAIRPAAAPVQPVTVGIVAINDFHGSIEPPRQSVLAPDGKGGQVQVPAGGAAWLASAVDTVRSQYPYHLTVSAGDLISASQLASSIYLDEPAIGVMNRLGLDFNAVGNHEFDRGRTELLRMQNGGCAQNTPRKPCAVEQFKGAQFRFLAASTLTESGKPLFPPYMIRSFGSGRQQVKVAIIGLTLKGTPDLVSPGGIKGLRFADEADTINALVPVLKGKGADAVVVLIHQGGTQDSPGDPNGCAGFTGEIRPILDRLDPRVDLVVSGHTHKAYVCSYGDLNPARPILLTSAGVYGQLVTDITLQIDPAAHRVVAKRARNVIVQSAPYTGSSRLIPNTALYPQFAPRGDVAAYVQTYADAAKGFASRPAGKIAGPASGLALGQLIADGQLAATRSAGAQIALMNPFGIRSTLVPRDGGLLTFGDLYAVQPFNNTLVTQSMTGAELKAVLEQGFDANGPEQVLIPSAGFSFNYDKARPVGQRIAAMSLNGQPIDPAGMYRVTTNSFLAQGGDSFTVFAAQRTAQIGVSDLEALEAWLKADPARPVPAEARATEIKP